MFFSTYLTTLTFGALLASTSVSASSQASHTRNITTPYPNRTEIAAIFNHLAEGNFTAFFSSVVDDVDWTLMGTHPLAGEYHNKTVFEVDALLRLGNTADPQHPITLNVVNIVGGGDEEWSVQELHALGLCKNGLVFDNTYSWVTRWNTQGLIVQVRAYLDSALIAKAIVENESVFFTYSDQRTALMPGPVGLNCQA